MVHQLRNVKFYAMVLADSAAFTLAFMGAYWIRFELSISWTYADQIVRILPWIVTGRLAIFFYFGLYRGMWRYSGMEDLSRLFQACLVSSLFTISTASYLFHFQGFPRAIFILDGILTFLLAGGIRLGIRWLYTANYTNGALASVSLPSVFGTRPRSARRVLVIGAGGSGEKLLREIFDNPQLNYQVVGFLDDDRRKWDRTLHGIRVLGNVEKLPQVKETHRVDEVFICTPSATGNEMRRILERCETAGVPHKTLPALGAIIDGKVSVKKLRDVNYEDLLRRAPIELEDLNIAGYIRGKTVLVTGSGGSIGSELCRQLVRFAPERLILVDSSEVHLFNMQMELQHDIGFQSYRPILGRVQDRPLMADVFHEYSPRVVFHAAAYKHVPMLEKNPWEAVFNNILGTKVTMELAVEHAVERFVLVSTDKAVRPTNVMGASKRVTELIMHSLQGHSTRFMAVRFGNVVGSSGSVIPLFRKQIEQGGPVTVTHPEVTRYFMTIPEAAQLILQAGALGEGGEIFILEMGTPVKIARMAEELIHLSGKEPGKDIQIVYTGLREGEKLYEELITQGEGIVATRHNKIMVLRPHDGMWGKSDNPQAFKEWLSQELTSLYHIARSHSAEAIKAKLHDILPEYAPQEGECVLHCRSIPEDPKENRVNVAAADEYGMLPPKKNREKRIN